MNDNELQLQCIVIGYNGHFHLTQYHIAGNFRGRKLWRISESKKFAEKTFVDCLVPPIMSVHVAVDFRGENFHG